MIALVISIIVMLILAGVSISAIVGEDGILSKAKQASIASNKASILEELNMKLTEYNINTFTDKDTGAKKMLKEMIDGGYIDSVLNSGGNYVVDSEEALPVPQYVDNKFTGEFAYGVKKDDFKINIYTANDGIYKAEYGDISFASGGSVEEGTVLVTGDSFNTAEDVPEEEKGKYEVTGDSNIIFIDKIEGELSFDVKSGAHAKINIFNDMTLTNAGMTRSAINIEPGGTLDLYVEEGATLTVNSGFGKAGETASGFGAKGGPGGYAGIRVPSYEKATDVIVGYDDSGEAIIKHYESSYGTLNLSGGGTIIAIGGDAGRGATAASTDTGGGRRRWSWCRNRWKWRKWWSS